eukprot:tig00020725_g13530.t1
MLCALSSTLTLRSTSGTAPARAVRVGPFVLRPGSRITTGLFTSLRAAATDRDLVTLVTLLPLSHRLRERLAASPAPPSSSPPLLLLRPVILRPRLLLRGPLYPRRPTGPRRHRRPRVRLPPSTPPPTSLTVPGRGGRRPGSVLIPHGARCPTISNTDAETRRPF